MDSELAAAILALKEMYERDAPAPAESKPPAAGERGRAEQTADRAEADPTLAWAAEAKARARISRAMTALGAEHEKRLAIGAELDRARSEIETVREQLREAVRQAGTAEERAEQAEASAQHPRGTSSRQWLLVSALAVVCLLGGWLLRVASEPDHAGSMFAAAGDKGGGNAAMDRSQPKSEPATRSTEVPPPERSEAAAVPQSSAPTSGAGESQAQVARPMEAVAGPVPATAPNVADASAGQARDASPPTAPAEQQQAVAVPSREATQEGSRVPPSGAGPNQLQGSDTTVEQEATAADKTVAQVKAAPPQTEPRVSTDDMTAAGAGAPPASPGQTAPSPSAPVVATTPAPAAPAAPAATVAKTGGTVPAVAGIAVAHITVHYEQTSSRARSGAEGIAALLQQAGFGGPQVVSSQHEIEAPVVRYFFANDAEAAGRIVAELRKKDSRWQIEDCTRFRRKPSAGTLQVWPAQVR